MLKIERIIALVAVLACAIAEPAVAQSVSQSATIDLTPVLSLFNETIKTLGVALVAGCVAWVGKHVHNDGLRKALDAAIQRGAAGVYEALVSAGASYSNVPVKNVAIADAANFIVHNMPKTVAAFGHDHASIQDLIQKSLGALLAADPTVTITPANRAAAAPVNVPAAVNEPVSPAAPPFVQLAQQAAAAQAQQ